MIFFGISFLAGMLTILAPCFDSNGNQDAYKWVGWADSSIPIM